MTTSNKATIINYFKQLLVGKNILFESLSLPKTFNKSIYNIFDIIFDYDSCDREEMLTLQLYSYASNCKDFYYDLSEKELHELIKEKQIIKKVFYSERKIKIELI